MSTPFPRLLLPAHAVATLSAILIVILAPPVSGRMMLVPIGSPNAGSVATDALNGGALLLGAGPVSGSIIVLGDRSALQRAIAGRRVLILAAPPGGCGSEATA